jgi:RimJ/RimL family protein N-acetyltransferase
LLEGRHKRRLSVTMVCSAMTDTAAPFRLPESPPRLSDEVAALRLLAPADTDLVVSGSQDSDVTRWTFLPARLDTSGAAALLQRWAAGSSDGLMRQYAIADARDTATPVGIGSLILQDADDPRCVDVAYWLLPQGRGRGLVTHAVQLMLAWAFDLAGCHGAVLHTMEGNTASEAVAERAGFSVVGRRTWNHGGRRVDLRRWMLEAPPR